jgi:hypothetical protein
MTVDMVDISKDPSRQSFDLTAGMRDHMTVQPPPSAMQQTGPLIAPSSNPEKNTLSEVEMNLSTPIEEVLDTPLGMMNPQVGLQQPNMMDSRTVQEHPARPVEAVARQTESKNPLNLNDDQLLALLSGVAAVVAFSKQVQSKVGELMPSAFGMDGHLSTTGLALTAFIAAVVFYILKNFVVKR